MFTTNEVAEMLDVTPGRVRQMVVAGAIQAEKRGRDLLIPQSQVEKARGRKTTPGPEKLTPEKLTEEEKAALPPYCPPTTTARVKTKARPPKAAKRSKRGAK